MTDYFPGIDTIAYEGPTTDNALAFRHYNADELVEGKSMREHLRFAAAYWHCFCNGCADQFGGPTRTMPWEDADPMQTARNKVDANFELCTKLGIEYYCFHDTDVAPEGETLAESFANFDEIAAYLKAKQDETGVKLLWGTANCFSHPRFVHGAGTSCNADAFAYAAAKIAKAIEVTHALGGEGYVFWGGREGYKTLLNTDMGRELDHLAALLKMAVEHKKKIGFTGQFYIEPKPKEPTKHQYDSDAAACFAFLQKYGLENDFKMNIEANHATLAGHDFQHELEFSAINGILGSVDANRGDLMLGWDTDQFPTDIRETTLAMLSILGAGGFTTGGLNFDAHVARESIDPVDLFHAHIGAMDAFARGLKNAAAIRAGGKLDAFKKERYGSWDTGIGAQIEAGQLDMDALKAYMLDKGEVDANASGRVEMLENLLNDYI
ncbi:MAG: xylose isomerase [Phycisphaerales bacterium]|jgi:xylose isomerase|nr:xylose isomerase [Phycisphaerales bacterium]MBT7170592.1 xylose isomerase [Phycisphaerales bacterium]